MIGRKLDALLAFIGLCTVAYVFFRVPLGQRTMYEHAKRIAATEPARELETDVRSRSDEVRREVTSKVKQLASDALDGGLRHLP